MERKVVSFKKGKSVTLPFDFSAVDVHRRRKSQLVGNARGDHRGVSMGEAVILWAGGFGGTHGEPGRGQRQEIVGRQVPGETKTFLAFL